MSPFVGFPEFTERLSGDRRSTAIPRLGSATLASEKKKQNDTSRSRSATFEEQAPPMSDVLPSSGLGCTHLWLHSRVPLG